MSSYNTFFLRAEMYKRYRNKCRTYSYVSSRPESLLALRSGSTIANEVYPRRGYC